MPLLVVMRTRPIMPKRPLQYLGLFFALSLGSAVAQSVERATPGEEVPGSIPAVTARSLLIGLVS